MYAAVAYITIGDNYDDFVLASDRTKPAAPVGEANMVQMYDSAIVYLDRALVIAKALSQHRAPEPDPRVARAGKVLDGRVANAQARSHDAGQSTRQRRGSERRRDRCLAVMTSGYRYRCIATTANTGTNNVGSEMNSRQEIRAGGEYINPDPTRSNLQPLLGVAGIKLKDPVTGQADPVINKAIDECCRVAATTLIPFTLTSWKEMQLILAEASLVHRQHDGFPNENQRRARARCASGVGRNNAAGAGHADS